MGVTWDTGAVSAAYRRAAEEALGDAAEAMLTEANLTVPHEFGDLEGSGIVTQDGLTAVVSYDTPYAVRQHEDTRLRHLGKGRAKWLEHTFRERSSKTLAFIAERMRRSL